MADGDGRTDGQKWTTDRLFVQKEKKEKKKKMFT
jgi:hypothetical protein